MHTDFVKRLRRSKPSPTNCASVYQVVINPFMKKGLTLADQPFFVERLLLTNQRIISSSLRRLSLKSKHCFCHSVMLVA